MILVDTSVWVNHLKVGDAGLASLLTANAAVIHPFTEGELALAGAGVGRVLGGVPRLPIPRHEDVLAFVQRQAAPVRRIGWVDAHVVYAALAGDHDLFTYDTHQADLFERARP